MTPELINELVAVLCDDLYIEVHTAERYPPMVYAPSLARHATMKIAT